MTKQPYVMSWDDNGFAVLQWMMTVIGFLDYREVCLIAELVMILTIRLSKLAFLLCCQLLPTTSSCLTKQRQLSDTGCVTSRGAGRSTVSHPDVHPQVGFKSVCNLAIIFKTWVF